jgi:hypothetical protein
MLQIPGQEGGSLQAGESSARAGLEPPHAHRCRATPNSRHAIPSIVLPGQTYAGDVFCPPRLSLSRVKAPFRTLSAPWHSPMGKNNLSFRNHHSSIPLYAP